MQTGKHLVMDRQAWSQSLVPASQIHILGQTNSKNPGSQDHRLGRSEDQEAREEVLCVSAVDGPIHVILMGKLKYWEEDRNRMCSGQLQLEIVSASQILYIR